MTIWEAVLLGVVQGLTEFLPISSTAHLLVVRSLLGHAHPEDAFTVVIQLGTLVAVFAYFRADVARLVRGIGIDLVRVRIGATPDGRLAWLIALGTVPAIAVGFFLKDWLKRTFFNLHSVAVVSIVFALLMLAAEWWALRRAATGSIGSAGKRDRLVGCALGGIVAGLCAHAGRVALGDDHHRRPLCRIHADRGGALLVPPVVAGDSRRGAQGTRR